MAPLMHDWGEREASLVLLASLVYSPTHTRVRRSQSQDSSRNVLSALAVIQCETADASDEVGRYGGQDVLVDAVEKGGGGEGASDTPNEDFHRVVAIAQPFALAEHVAHCETGLELSVNKQSKSNIRSFLKRENGEENGGVGGENASRRRLLALGSAHASVHLPHVPAHQNVVKPLSELPHRSLRQSASLGSRTRDVDRLVVRVACRPDPVAIPRLGSSRACRELEGATANGDDGR